MIEILLLYVLPLTLNFYGLCNIVTRLNPVVLRMWVCYAGVIALIPVMNIVMIFVMISYHGIKPYVSPKLYVWLTSPWTKE